MTTLRDYQTGAVNEARKILFIDKKRSVVLNAPTGSGKTAIASAIVKAMQEKNKRSWFIMPRKELLNQTKKHYSKWGISFGVIDAKHKESRAYKAHIISLQTILRRMDKIKQPPDIIIFDECHLNYDAQERIFKILNEKIKIIGLTATPGRLDNRGLGTLYDDIIYVATIPYLTACGFLSPLKYYAPPTDGIKNLKFRSTGEVDQNELDKLLTDRAIYGRAVDYYEKLAKQENGTYRRGVGFCAGVRAAEKQAAEFRSRGFIAESIDGKMPEKKQRALLDGLASGKIQVLCSADLLLYGWDSPNVSYGFLLRRTKSKALYFQIVGRILRVADGKPDAIFVDHTGCVDLHTDREYPGIPPFYLEHVDWNFHSTANEKEKDKNPPPACRLCPSDNFRICTLAIRCNQCDKYVPVYENDTIIESVPLQERQQAANPHLITSAEKREIQDEVLRLVRAAKEADSDDKYNGCIFVLCEIAKKLGYKTLWVYWQVTENKYTVDMRAIHAIQRANGYKYGWTHFIAQEIKSQILQIAKESA